MRKLLLPLLFLAFAVAAPLSAVAIASDGGPNAATVAACKAEYAQLGADAFNAKYGPTEPWGHCYTANPGATLPEKSPPGTTTTTALDDNSPQAQCKREYAAIGADAFAAKYGTPETFGNCVAAHGGAPATTTTKPVTTTAAPTPAPVSEAQALCLAEKQKLGADAFNAKYGPTEPFGNCVKAQARRAAALVLTCKSTSTKSKDAYTSCLKAAATNAFRRR